jgi:hypothetical protein
VENVQITTAVAVPTPAGAVKVAHCRVSGVIDKEIRFTELLPDRWNERFFAGGGGGFAGALDNHARTSVNLGYATVGTDTGHQAAQFEAGWALDNRERQVNYGYLAIHRTADVEDHHQGLLRCRAERTFSAARTAVARPHGSAAISGRLDGIVSCAPVFNLRIPLQRL